MRIGIFALWEDICTHILIDQSTHLLQTSTSEIDLLPFVSVAWSSSWLWVVIQLLINSVRFEKVPYFVEKGEYSLEIGQEAWKRQNLSPSVQLEKQQQRHRNRNLAPNQVPYKSKVEVTIDCQHVLVSTRADVSSISAINEAHPCR